MIHCASTSGQPPLQTAGPEKQPHGTWYKHGHGTVDLLGGLQCLLALPCHVWRVVVARRISVSAIRGTKTRSARIKEDGAVIRRIQLKTKGGPRYHHLCLGRAVHGALHTRQRRL